MSSDGIVLNKSDNRCGMPIADECSKLLISLESLITLSMQTTI